MQATLPTSARLGREAVGGLTKCSVSSALLRKQQLTSPYYAGAVDIRDHSIMRSIAYVRCSSTRGKYISRCLGELSLCRR